MKATGPFLISSEAKRQQERRSPTIAINLLPSQIHATKLMSPLGGTSPHNPTSGPLLDWATQSSYLGLRLFNLYSILYI
jgi:hypothetical protein